MQMQNQNYEQIVVISKSLLDTVQCNQLISKHDTANLDNIIQKTYRNVRVANMDINDVPHLIDCLKFINEKHFKLDLNFNQIDCFFGRYDEGMHYNSLHMDCIAGDVQRKLSFSLLLNDNFQGGDFITLTKSTLDCHPGKLLIFPSFMPHKISVVEEGTRYAIFGWVYGPNFR
jgi:predicted 2-oxoglutarate/Fe(II)-dependent dioxygenase YbiX